MFEEQRSRKQLNWAFVQFIADVSLNANCRPREMRLALALIAELTSDEDDLKDDDLFYNSQ